MKTKITLRKLTEPFAYLVLVAAFGFITTVVTQTQGDEKSRDTELVTLSLEDDIQTLFIEDNKEIKL